MLKRDFKLYRSKQTGYVATMASGSLSDFNTSTNSINNGGSIDFSKHYDDESLFDIDDGIPVCITIWRSLVPILNKVNESMKIFMSELLSVNEFHPMVSKIDDNDAPKELLKQFRPCMNSTHDTIFNNEKRDNNTNKNAGDDDNNIM